MPYLNELFGLRGKTAFVTGGAQGVGKVVALGMARCGMDVAVVDMNKEKAEEVAHQIGKLGVRSLALKVDVTSVDDVDLMMSTIVDEFGHIDVALNNAGIATNTPSELLTERDWRKIFDISLAGVFLTAQAAGRRMIGQGGGGSIINTASMSERIVNRPQPQSAYNASKAGVVQLTKSLAVEWVTHNIRVNCISPGYINAEMTAHARTDWRDSHLRQNAIHHIGIPENLIGGVLYLASDAASFVTGADLVMD